MYFTRKQKMAIAVLRDGGGTVYTRDDEKYNYILWVEPLRKTMLHEQAHEYLKATKAYCHMYSQAALLPEGISIQVGIWPRCKPALEDLAGKSIKEKLRHEEHKCEFCGRVFGSEGSVTAHQGRLGGACHRPFLRMNFHLQMEDVRNCDATWYAAASKISREVFLAEQQR
jgi:hypothetical protein